MDRFFSFELQNSVYILDISPLLNRYIIKICFQVCGLPIYIIYYLLKIIIFNFDEMFHVFFSIYFYYLIDLDIKSIKWVSLGLNQGVTRTAFFLEVAEDNLLSWPLPASGDHSFFAGGSLPPFSKPTILGQMIFYATISLLLSFLPFFSTYKDSCDCLAQTDNPV